MVVRIIKTCFVNGALRNPGELVELNEGQKPSKKCMIVLTKVPEGAKVVANPEPAQKGKRTRKELQTELDAAGVAYDAGATVKELEELLRLVKSAGTGGVVIEEKIPGADDDEVI